MKRKDNTISFYEKKNTNHTHKGPQPPQKLQTKKQTRHNKNATHHKLKGTQTQAGMLTFCLHTYSLFRLLPIWFDKTTKSLYSMAQVNELHKSWISNKHISTNRHANQSASIFWLPEVLLVHDSLLTPASWLVRGMDYAADTAGQCTLAANTITVKKLPFFKRISKHNHFINTWHTICY